MDMGEEIYHCLSLEGHCNNKYPPFMTIQMINIHYSMKKDIYISTEISVVKCTI